MYSVLVLVSLKVVPLLDKEHKQAYFDEANLLLKNYASECLVSVHRGKAFLAILEPGYPEEDSSVIKDYYAYLHASMFDENPDILIHGKPEEVTVVTPKVAKDILLRTYHQSLQTITHGSKSRDRSSSHSGSRTKLSSR
jgi:hypothetical protein